MGEPAGTGNGPCPLQAAAGFAGIAHCSLLLRGFCTSPVGFLSSPGAPQPSRSSLVCIAPAVTGRSKPLVGQAGPGGRLRVEKHAQELRRCSWCFKRSKTLLNSRCGFYLELRRSTNPPPPSLLSTSVEFKAQVSSTPKSSPLGCRKFMLRLPTRYPELFTFLHQSRGQGHLEVSGWWSLTPIAVGNQTINFIV